MRCLVGWIHPTLAGWRPLVHGRFPLLLLRLLYRYRPGPILRSWHPHRSVRQLIEWGATLTPSGAGGAASPDTAGSVRARRQSTRARGDGSARLRLLPTLLGVRPHHWRRAYSSSEEREYEHWHIRKVLLLSVSEKGTVVAASSGQRLHDGVSPTGGGGETQCTICKTTILET